MNIGDVITLSKTKYHKDIIIPKGSTLIRVENNKKGKWYEYRLMNKVYYIKLRRWDIDRIYPYEDNGIEINFSYK
jgi:hypothetical protein